MSFNQSMGTITVDEVTYDVKETGIDLGTSYTLEFDGEAMFEGLEGKCEMEQFDMEHFNPRQDSNIGVISVYYRGYNLGDEDIRDVEFEITCPTCDGSGESQHWMVGFHQTATPLVTGSEEECQAWLDKRLDVVSGSYYIEPIGCSRCKGDGRIEVNPVDYFKQERKARVVLPVIVYEHSGITMQVGHVGQVMGDAQGWDTSFVGFIFDTPETVEECIGKDATDEQIEKALRGEVESYASYLEGDVSGYTVEDDETNFYESCCGFLGDSEACEAEMYSDLERALVKRIAEESERLYWLEREVVTV